MTNLVIISGNAVKDAEFTTTTNGKSVAKFSVACRRNTKNAQGEYDSDFFNVVAWGTTADYCHNYLKKGNRVNVVGSLQTRSYNGNDGNKKYVTEIIASQVEIISSKSNNSETQQTSGGSKKPAHAEQNVMKFEPIDDSQLPF